MYEHLANVYHKNLDYGDLLNECEHLKHCMVLDENCETPCIAQKNNFTRKPNGLSRIAKM
jgi:hypothetical protein